MVLAHIDKILSGMLKILRRNCYQFDAVAVGTWIGVNHRTRGSVARSHDNSYYIPIRIDACSTSRPAPCEEEPFQLITKPLLELSSD